MKNGKSLFVLVLCIFLTNTALAATSSDEALDYRMRGYKLQQAGDLDQAMQYYKKAAALDAAYAAPHNDLGVIYEMRNRLDKAEEAYLTALQINPNYSGVYSNLAALYEKKGDIPRALAYWEKRANFGQANDPWRQKAAANAERLRAILETSSAAPHAATGSAYGTSESERAMAMQIAEMLAQKKEEEGKSLTANAPIDESYQTNTYPQQGVSSSANQGRVSTGPPSRDIYAARDLVSEARHDLKKERFQDALAKLYDAREKTDKTRLVNELIDEARSRAIDSELGRLSANVDLYKKGKYLEVEEAWFPPEPDENVSDVTQAFFAATEKSPARLELERKAREVIPTIDFADAQLKEVVEFLAVSNDINIVIDETVVPSSETVTVHLKNIPLAEALDIILRTKGLKYRFEENIIWITTEEKLLEEDLVVRVYDVQDIIGKLYDFPSEPFDFKQNLELAGDNE